MSNTQLVIGLFVVLMVLPNIIDHVRAIVKMLEE